MKKYVFSLALTAVVLFMFTACDTNIANLSDAEIEAIYQKAVEAFGWFDVETMPLDTTYEAVCENGFVYWRVDFEGINTLADLEAYLGTLFSPEIISGLFADGISYREFDGVLYAIGASRGGNLTRGDEVHEIIRNIREDNSNIIYRVTVDVLNVDNLEEVVGFEIYDFVLSYVNGNWIFLNFNLVW